MSNQTDSGERSAVRHPAELQPRGPFSLRAAAQFGFGPTSGAALHFDGAMRLAFPVDGGHGYAAAVLREKDGGPAIGVELELRDGAEATVALAQVARIVSLDHDGEQFLRVGERDPVLGRLQHEHPGQRPVLFHSPYEAAAWSIISARRPAAQAAKARSAVAQQLGHSFSAAGQTLDAFPQPDRLLELAEDFPGLNARKVSWLHELARAALAGQLDVSRLQALGPERAFEDVQLLKGLGPFYAGLVTVRATGLADALLPSPEPRAMRAAAEFYGLPEPPDLAGFAQLAARWRPFRTWATVLIRVAYDRRPSA